MKHYKYKMKDTISYVFSFLLTLLLVVLFICAGFHLGVFDNKSVTRAIYESRYYHKVYEELEKETKETITSAGFPATVLEDAITLERVYIGSKNYVERALRGEDPLIKTDKLRSILGDNLDAYLKKENIIRTSRLDTSMEELITLIESKYKDAIQLQLAKDIASYRSKYETLVRFLIPILFVLIGVLCGFLIKLHRYPHKGVRFIVCSLMTASVMTMLVAFLLLKTKQYTNIDVNPDYYKNLIISYLHWDTMIFVYIGGIGLTVAVALATLVHYLKSRIAFQ